MLGWIVYPLHAFEYMETCIKNSWVDSILIDCYLNFFGDNDFGQNFPGDTPNVVNVPESGTELISSRIKIGIVGLVVDVIRERISNRGNVNRVRFDGLHFDQASTAIQIPNLFANRAVDRERFRLSIKRHPDGGYIVLSDKQCFLDFQVFDNIRLIRKQLRCDRKTDFTISRTRKNDAVPNLMVA